MIGKSSWQFDIKQIKHQEWVELSEILDVDESFNHSSCTLTA
jgi:hypothetical protein